MAATRNSQRGWWKAVPAPLRIGSELIAGYIVATTLAKYLGPVFAGFEVVVLALVGTGIAHASGRLTLIDEYPALRAFFDWYTAAGRSRHRADAGVVVQPGSPLDARTSRSPEHRCV